MRQLLQPLFGLWNKTKLGKTCCSRWYEEAATVSGVNIIKTVVLVCLMAGILYGFGGF